MNHRKVFRNARLVAIGLLNLQLGRVNRALSATANSLTEPGDN